ncbi:MAG: flagellar biosynthetic protein FliR, partial [Deltaproteobacteria bacterium]|nr:flagellar biosynthetic protein FliR [Deltaproteobacteria bacterium]
SGIQVSILANLAYFTAMVLFLSFDGHHIMLRAMKESFQIIPPGSLAISGDLVQEVINLAGDMFVIALKIGAPAIAVLFFTKVAFGLVVKLIPQMNIMIVAFPVQIVLGLIFFGICLGLLSRFLDIYMDRLGPLLINTMNIMKG